jgi:hypothetical protein
MTLVIIDQILIGSIKCSRLSASLFGQWARLNLPSSSTRHSGWPRWTCYPSATAGGTRLAPITLDFSLSTASTGVSSRRSFSIHPQSFIIELISNQLVLKARCVRLMSGCLAITKPKVRNSVSGLWMLVALALCTYWKEYTLEPTQIGVVRNKVWEL